MGDILRTYACGKGKVDNCFFSKFVFSHRHFIVLQNVNDSGGVKVTRLMKGAIMEEALSTKGDLISWAGEENNLKRLLISNSVNFKKLLDADAKRDLVAKRLQRQKKRLA